jgi:hypothetical protein
MRSLSPEDFKTHLKNIIIEDEHEDEYQVMQRSSASRTRRRPRSRYLSPHSPPPADYESP